MWISRKHYNFLKKNAENNINNNAMLTSVDEVRNKAAIRAMEEYSSVLKERDELRLQLIELKRQKDLIVDSKDNYRLLIDQEDFQQKVLEYMGSEEMNKMIDSTVFKDKPECINAIIHGMAIASMITSRCDLFRIQIKENEQN